jgi:prenyltransferase beta subunit
MQFLFGAASQNQVYNSQLLAEFVNSQLVNLKGGEQADASHLVALYFLYTTTALLNSPSGENACIVSNDHLRRFVNEHLLPTRDGFFGSLYLGRAIGASAMNHLANCYSALSLLI